MPSTRPLSLPLLPALLATVTLVLAACGGGGGGGGGGGTTNVPATDPVVVAPVPTTGTLQTDIAAPSFAADSGELAAWNYLQAARTGCGFGSLSENTRLDTASRAHASYLLAESTGTDLVVGHGEPNVNNAFFTGNSPSDRAVFAGYGANVSELLSASLESYRSSGPIVQLTDAVRGQNAMRNLLNSVDHLKFALSGARVAGLGARTSSRTTLAGGVTTIVVNHRLGMLLGFVEGTQLLGAGNVANYPCAGSTGIDYAFAPATETPNPFPEITDSATLVGPPLYIRADAGAVLSITANSIKDAAGVAQPVRTQVGELGTHEFFMVPAAKLVPGATYTVNFAGTANGVAFNRTFSFTTRS